MRDNGAFRGKAFSMLRLLLLVGDSNEQGEVGIRMPCALEIGIELLLNQLPNRVAPRLDHHAATHLGVLS